MTLQEPPLSERERRAIAWSRFRRMMGWMVLAAVLTVAVALLYLHLGPGLVTIHMVIATIAGVGGSVLLASALMLLVFMSSGTGHDEQTGRTDEAQ